jgi:iron complex transport system substrate-binding protein
MKVIRSILIFIAGFSIVSTALCAERVVEDMLGRKVSLTTEPKRIVALAPSITEIVFALNQSQSLVGVTQFSDFPEAAGSLPKVGSYVHLDLERIVSLQPDLCIAIKDGNPKDVVERLLQLKIPVFVVNPRDIQSVVKTIAMIGNILNARDTASSIVTDMLARVERIEDAVSKIENRPRVFFQIGIAPIVSVGSSTFIHELIETAGGINIAAGPVPYPRYSREQVLGLAPEVIIITSMARAAIFDQVAREWAQWSELPAARKKQIYVIKSDFLHRPSPRMIAGLEQLAGLLHPQLFGKTP